MEIYYLVELHSPVLRLLIFSSHSQTINERITIQPPADSAGKAMGIISDQENPQRI